MGRLRSLIPIISRQQLKKVAVVSGGPQQLFNSTSSEEPIAAVMRSRSTMPFFACSFARSNIERLALDRLIFLVLGAEDSFEAVERDARVRRLRRTSVMS